jgi:hypothetical protein
MTSGIDPADLAELLKEAVRLVERKKKKAAPKKKKKSNAGAKPSLPQFATLEEWERHYKGKKKVCPNDGLTKDMVKDFGARAIRGVYYVHSWCRACRATTNYNARPRKYRTRSQD